MSRVRIATVAGDIEREAHVAEALLFSDEIDLVLRCLDRVELLAAIRGGHLDAVVFIEEPVWLDRQCIVEAAQQGIRAVAIADRSRFVDPQGVLGRDTDIKSIVDACSTAPPLPMPSAGLVGSGSGRLTAVWGPKGSPGRTRVAIELAMALRSTDASTLLIDGDPYGGDVLQTLGIVEELPTIIWASRMAAKEELDEDQLQRNLRSVERGPVILPGLPRPELWADVSQFGLGELLRIVRSSFQHAVVDTGFCLEPNNDAYANDTDGRNRMARSVISKADRVVAVCRADPIGIKNFLWAFDAVRALVDPDRVVIAVNRVVDGTERDIARLLHKHLGKRPVAYLPDRPGILHAALETHSSFMNIKGSGDLRAGVEALAISVGARLRPRGVLSSLGARH